jgi:uncharacterized protein (DUF302 family)
MVGGSAKAVTPLMQANQEIGIDLPLKALVFEDAAGNVWLSYNDPRWLLHSSATPNSLAQAGREVPLL